MRDYGQVYSTFWTSQTTSGLTDDGKLLALYLMTCPHANGLGCFRLTDGYVMDDLRWVRERVTKGFAELLANGWANRCETTGWVLISKHLYWNKPENPNQVKSVARLASMVPLNANITGALKAALDQYVATNDADASKQLSEAKKRLSSETVSKPFLNQDQDQDQNQDVETLVETEPTVSTPECPHELIVAAYHAELPMLRQVREWSPQRQAYLRSRWREKPERQTVQWWIDLFRYIRGKCPFLIGQKKAEFQVDLEWIVRPTNFLKIIEGKYEEGARAA